MTPRNENSRLQCQRGLSRLQELNILTWLSTFRYKPQPRGQMLRVLQILFFALHFWFLRQTRRDTLGRRRLSSEATAEIASVFSLNRRFRSPDAHTCCFPRICRGEDQDNDSGSSYTKKNQFKSIPSLPRRHIRIDKGLKSALMKGFGQFFDKQYADLRLQLHQVGATLPVRRATLAASAELVAEMTKTKRYHVHLDQNIGHLYTAHQGSIKEGNSAYRKLRGWAKRYADLRPQLHQVGRPLPVRRATLVASAESVVETGRYVGRTRNGVFL